MKRFFFRLFTHWELVRHVRAMHLADEAYGCGFYDDEDWRRHYEETRRLVFKE